MKPDRIKVSQEFPGLWLSVDIPIAPEENIIEEFKKGRSLLVDAYNSSNGSNTLPDSVPVVQVETNKEDEINKNIQTINECKTLRNLEMFANTVQRLNVDVLYEAYHNRKKELQ